MKSILSAINQIPLGVIIILCATLGLAPFTPPHVVAKLSLLVKGTLVKPIDWFDLFLHGTPWLLLILKLVAARLKKTHKPEPKG